MNCLHIFSISSFPFFLYPILILSPHNAPTKKNIENVPTKFTTHMVLAKSNAISLVLILVILWQYWIQLLTPSLKCSSPVFCDPPAHFLPLCSPFFTSSFWFSSNLLIFILRKQKQKQTYTLFGCFKLTSNFFIINLNNSKGLNFWLIMNCKTSFSMVISLL